MKFLFFSLGKKKQKDDEVYNVEYLNGNEQEHDRILMKKHLEKVKSSEIINKYGLITYSYDNKKIENYRPRKLNIGDYIQSVAARQFLPRVDEYIERDSISSYNGQKVNLIMNAWWYIHDGNRTFSNNINPLFVSFHINNKNEVIQNTLDYLKLHEPIGCRDKSTRDFLLSKGIEAYFSGCMTLTLGKTYKNNPETRDNLIYFVDIKRMKFKKEIKEILKAYTGCKIKKISHMLPFDKKYSPDECFKMANDILKGYEKAKLVVTDRIHCAMPCIAMGTPVILLINKYDKKRFNGLKEFFNILGVDENNKFVIDILRDNNGLVLNKDNYKSSAEFLTKICEEFVKAL